MNLYSDDDDDLKFMGTLPETGTVIITALFIRNEQNGVYIAVGAICLKWILRKSTWKLTRRRIYPGV